MRWTKESRVQMLQYPSVLNPILDAIDGISEMSSKIMQHGTGFPTPEEYEILSVGSLAEEG